MGGSFNTREFFHGAKRVWLRAVKWAFLVLAFPVPIVLLRRRPGYRVRLWCWSWRSRCSMSGLLAERWFFFAQANHPQNLYYQAIS